MWRLLRHCSCEDLETSIFVGNISLNLIDHRERYLRCVRTRSSIVQKFCLNTQVSFMPRDLVTQKLATLRVFRSIKFVSPKRQTNNANKRYFRKHQFTFVINQHSFSLHCQFRVSSPVRACHFPQLNVLMRTTL